VLFNLVVNARDASTAHGQVEVRLGREDLDTERQGRYGVVEAGSYVTLTVSDHGSGMSEDVLSQLFEPFYTTKPQGKGTGLGLSTVYGIVLQHRGGIAVDSAEDSGSTFTVFWPRREDDVLLCVTDDTSPVEQAPLVDSASGATPSAAARTETLLLVDDEPAVRRTVAKLLERAGFRVLQAASGREALDLLSSAPTTVDALVTDVRMPDMSGVELVETMTERQIDIPVLFISGQIDDPIPVDWHSDKPRSFLRKPFQGDELSTKVRELFPVAS
jgi:two-component system, cell cycle sensor histidine kinase and response regulator CckA